MTIVIDYSSYNMKKTIVSLLLLIAVLSSCQEKETNYNIAVSQCASGRWRDKVNSEMLAAQHLYEQNVKVEVIEAHDDTELQIRQIDSLVNTDMDLLVVAPNEAKPLSAVIAKVRKKGIPVIFFDRKAETEDYTAFIGGNNVEAGLTVGNYALELAKEIRRPGSKPLILEITGSMSTSPVQERHKGFSKAMQGQTQIDYQYFKSTWSADDSYLVTKQLIEARQIPDIVFCHNDAMTSGVYKAVKEAGLESQTKILGIDGMPDEGIQYVLQGSLSGTYVYPTHGEEVVKLALNILTGQPFNRENFMKGSMVTPQNAQLMWLNSKELMRQNRDLITIEDKLEDYFGLYNTQKKVLIGSFIAIVLLIVAFIMMWRAYVQTRRAVRKRQTLNEEETLFYTNADSRTMRQVFETPKDNNPASRSRDSAFAETLNEAIRKNMSNPNLKMDELGEEMGLSRVQLYRKVKAITGVSPVELLRQVRLQQGYVLLTTTHKTVAEIALEVGYNNPGYFSKCFKEQYGKLPMDLRQ